MLTKSILSSNRAFALIQSVMLRPVLTATLVLLSVCWAAAEDRRLVGTWKAVTYEIQGRAHPMHGLFIFTRRHYSANVRYQAAAGPVDNANGNAGPYTADGRRIVFTQWVQIHVRRGRCATASAVAPGPQ